MFNKIILVFFFLSLSFCSNSTDQMRTSIDNSSSTEPPFKNEMLRLVNQLRKEGCRCGRKRMRSVPSVKWNNKLEQAALSHARDMNSKRFFEHEGSNGSSISERIENTGYNWQAVSENIFKGNANAREVFQTWKESPSHCKNMMSKDYKEMGVAKSGLYWVQDFGTSF